jgi:hypothetical protein
MEQEAESVPNSESRPTLLGHLAGVLEDHVNLAALEGRYEADLFMRRIFVLAAVVILCMAAFLLAQVAVIYGLSALGMPIWGASLLLGSVYALMGAMVFWRFGRRNPHAGAPFSGTRRELVHTLQWIQKLFS